MGSADILLIVYLALAIAAVLGCVLASICEGVAARRRGTIQRERHLL